jgi:ABC-type uncharacterized transport system ATPase subunit
MQFEPTRQETAAQTLTVVERPVPAQSVPVASRKGRTKRYGGLMAVDEITLRLERGTLTGYLGPNGRHEAR